ncbi:MAG: DUF6962 family protein [Lewinella sp.]|jgi:hypothetical protein|uniref:DUF6962 family protein n=1 Tax=Lewinella sp. TaxID=2004506 RepID=UPI003D6B7224
MEELLQPDIYLLGIRIQEPVTTATDVLVALACFYAYWRLRNIKTKGNALHFLKLYFIVMAIAMLFGGLIGHGFLYLLSPEWKIPGWFISMFSVMLIERSSIEHSQRLLPPRLAKFFLAANIIELGILMIVAAYTLNFLFIQIHLAYGILAVIFPFHLYTYRKTGNKGSLFMLYGVGVLAIAAVIFNYPIVLSKWFNHHDFAHVLMIITTIFFMYGGLNFDSNNQDKAI